MIVRGIWVLTISVCLSTVLFGQGQAKGDGRDADRALIRKDIEVITQAFIDLDVDKILAMHAPDWSGFLSRSPKPIKGIDEYMRAVVGAWPIPKDVQKPKVHPTGANAFKITDFEVTFYSPDIGVASFLLDFEKREGDKVTVVRHLRIMDVYAKRSNGWTQVASNTVVDPQWSAEQNVIGTNVPPVLKDQLLKAREAVWHAFYANDKATLEKMIPDEFVAMGADGDRWSNRASVFAGAEALAARGVKLTRLEFPKTEIQLYGSGSIAIIYTTYSYDIESDGVKKTTTGRATEVFLLRGGQWVNTGRQLEGLISPN